MAHIPLFSGLTPGSVPVDCSPSACGSYLVSYIQGEHFACYTLSVSGNYSFINLFRHSSGVFLML